MFYFVLDYKIDSFFSINAKEPGDYNEKYSIYSLLSLTEGSKNIYSKLKLTKINVARALIKLEGMGIIFYEEDIGYYIADPLFHQWIIQRI